MTFLRFQASLQSSHERWPKTILNHMALPLYLRTLARRPLGYAQFLKRGFGRVVGLFDFIPDFPLLNFKTELEYELLSKNMSKLLFCFLGTCVLFLQHMVLAYYFLDIFSGVARVIADTNFSLIKQCSI